MFLLGPNGVCSKGYRICSSADSNPRFCCLQGPWSHRGPHPCEVDPHPSKAERKGLREPGPLPTTGRPPRAGSAHCPHLAAGHQTVCILWAVETPPRFPSLLNTPEVYSLLSPQASPSRFLHRHDLSKLDSPPLISSSLDTSP